jgi:hypothetical protein
VNDGVTCCGEWTWNALLLQWERPHEVYPETRTYCEEPGVLEVEVVCKKCHRALREDGMLTEPLIGADQATDLWENQLIDALTKTWGEEESE